jgi:hypothetical protein
VLQRGVYNSTPRLRHDSHICKWTVNGEWAECIDTHNTRDGLRVHYKCSTSAVRVLMPKRHALRARRARSSPPREASVCMAKQETSAWLRVAVKRRSDGQSNSPLEDPSKVQVKAKVQAVQAARGTECIRGTAGPYACMPVYSYCIHVRLVCHFDPPPPAGD